MAEALNPYPIPHMLTVESLHTTFTRYYSSDYSFEGEMHDFWEMVYVFEGSAVILKNDKAYTLTKGEIAFHPPMEFHRIWSAGEPFSLLVISFSAHGNIMAKLSQNIYKLDIQQHNNLFDIKREIEETYEIRRITLYSKGESPLSLNTIALRLELFMLELLKYDVPQKKTNKNISAEFSKISSIFHGNIDKDLSVEELAKLSNLGVSNLKKICNKSIGVGPAKYFLRLKLAHAINLLKNGMNVTEVSEALGFSSQSYFSVVFKRETGVSPGEIKKSSS